MELNFTPKIDDVRAAMDAIERRAREGFRVGFVPQGTTPFGAAGGSATTAAAVFAPGTTFTPEGRRVGPTAEQQAARNLSGQTASAILSQSPPATANPLKGLTDAQSDRRFRSQISYDLSTMAGDPLRQSQTLNEAAASFEPGTVDNLRYRAAANRASSRHFANEERTFGQGIKELARQEAAAVGRRTDTPEGFWGGDPDVPQAATSTRAKANRAGGAASSNPRSSFELSGRRFFGVSTEGLSEYMTIGFAARTWARSLQAGREYGVGTMLAGGDQAAQLQATLDYRQSIASAGGFIGQTLAFLQDPTGSKEAGIRAQLQSAQVARQSIAFATRLSGITTAARNEYEVARETDPVQKKLKQVTAQEEERRAGFAKLRTAAGEQTDAEVNDLKARQAADRAEEVRKEIDRGGRNVVVTGGTGGAGVSITNNVSREEAERRVDARNAKAQDALRTSAGERRGDEVTAAERLSAATSEQERREVWRDESFRVGAIRTATLFEGLAGAAAARGDAAGAQIANLRGQAATETLLATARRDPATEDIRKQWDQRITTQEKINERERQLDIGDVRGAADVTRAGMSRNPLTARLAQIDENLRRNKARDTRPGMAQEYETGAEVERQAAKQEEQDEKRYRRAELRADRRGLEREVAGNFLAAQSGRAADAARIESAKLRERGDTGGSDMVLGNAILSQQAMKTRIMQTFEGKEIDINRTALSGPRSGEDPIEALHTIAEEIRGLRRDQTNGVNVPTVVD